jgi:hypothetical protein
MMHFENDQSKLALERICRIVSKMKEGEHFCVDKFELRDIQGFEYNDAIFKPADRVLGNIMGSAYKFSWDDSFDGRAVIFHRHKENGTIYYTDPDRRAAKEMHKQIPTP